MRRRSSTSTDRRSRISLRNRDANSPPRSQPTSLIIEDEALIALDLEHLVESLGHRTIGIARTRSEAIALSKAKRPGLILADIQLADGSSGLEAVNDLLSSFEVPVIFITAYPERYLTGERPEPAFLISKPYQPSTVSALVSQALFFERNAVQRKKAAVG
jgi:CheY-like chemotaxis protein